LKGWLISRFRRNIPGFWKTYRWFIVVFVVALFCDAASTIHFMLRAGPEIEIHPVIRFVSRMLGPVVGPLVAAVGKAFIGLVLAIYLRKFAAHLLITVSIISLWAGWYNIWGYKVYTPMILEWFVW
jgi:hypothetical protein